MTEQAWSPRRLRAARQGKSSLAESLASFSEADRNRLLQELNETITVDDAATDPTALTFRHKDPAGTLTAFVWGTDSELVRDSTGTFRVDLILADSGRHHYRWEATGSAHVAEEASFDVRTSNVV